MRWRAYLLFGFLAVGALALMMDPLSYMRRSYDRIAPDELYLNSAAAARQRAASELRTLTLLDSLTRALVREAPDGGFVLGVHPEVRLAHEEALRENAAALLAARPQPERVRVGIFLVDHQSHIPVGDLRGSVHLSTPRSFAGTIGGEPYCLRVVPISGTHVSEESLGIPVGREADWVRDFGLCAWVARYGLPGSDVAAWVAFHGGTIADKWWEDPVQLTREILRSVGRPEGRIPMDRCRLGDAADCASFFRADGLPPERLGESTGGPSDGPWLLAPWEGLGYDTPGLIFDRALLADLEREFGADAFARFWSSDLPVAAAFTTAFGVEPGGWYAERIRPIWKEALVAPGLDTGALLATLALLMIGFWVATRLARRRSPG